jgi:hypothetical protein
VAAEEKFAETPVPSVPQVILSYNGVIIDKLAAENESNSPQ